MDNKTTFTVIKDASYQLPVFTVSSNGLDLVADKTVDIQFVRNEKKQEGLTLLELYLDGAQPTWRQVIDDITNYYSFDDAKLKKIDAILIPNSNLEDSTYQLEIYDGAKNLGIMVKWTEVLDANNKPLTLSSLPERVYVAAIDSEQLTNKQDGTTIENLLAMLIFDLNLKIKEVPSRESAIAITKLEEAQMWLAKRSAERANRGVQFTNNK